MTNNKPLARTEPLFELGQTLATPGALAAIGRTGEDLLAFLSRHVTGDWGDLTKEDKHANEEALKHGARIFSAYHLANGIKIWIITEADRASTTVLLPSEY